MFRFFKEIYQWPKERGISYKARAYKPIRLIMSPFHQELHL